MGWKNRDVEKSSTHQWIDEHLAADGEEESGGFLQVLVQTGPVRVTADGERVERRHGGDDAVERHIHPADLAHHAHAEVQFINRIGEVPVIRVQGTYVLLPLSRGVLNPLFVELHYEDSVSHVLSAHREHAAFRRQETQQQLVSAVLVQFESLEVSGVEAVNVDCGRNGNLRVGRGDQRDVILRPVGRRR